MAVDEHSAELFDQGLATFLVHEGRQIPKEGDIMQGQRILVVEQESSIRTALFRLLDRLMYHVITANNYMEAMELIPNIKNLDLVICDMDLENFDCSQFKRQIISNNSNCQIVLTTKASALEKIVNATRLGITDILQKPLNLPSLVELIQSNLTEATKQIPVNKSTEIHAKYQFDNIIGTSPEITKVLELVERVANTNSTVLIMGESGTGKELIAKALHYNSSRANESLIPVNCGAIPGELLESELFGHVKGAFTGAIQQRIGRFQLANNGTLFLDEIGDMNINLQVKLLRVLQDKKVEAVGSTKLEDINVRLIAATNVNLEEKVKQGEFREDLFYRLNVIPIIIPALRERRSDIPVLIHHFIKKFNRTKNAEIQGISPEALEQLCSYNWPGNIRELENLCERLSILIGQGIIQLEDLPEKYRSCSNAESIKISSTEIPESGIDFNRLVDEYENNLILQALNKTGWNRNQAAKLLRLNRTTLVEKIKKKGLNPDDSSLQI